MSHNFNFAGGDLLSRMGASWFASYWNYCNKASGDTSWSMAKTAKTRINVYKKSTSYHNSWRQEIQKMDNKKLETNKIGLTGMQVKDLIK